MRLRLASIALLALVVVPVLATVWLGSKNTNFLGSILAAVFCASMAPEVVAAGRRHRWRTAALLGGGAVVVAGWTVFGRGYVVEHRFWLTVALVVAVPAFAAWLRATAPGGLRLPWLAKLAVTLVALAVVGAGLWWEVGGGAVPREMPIYRNVRHLNYDLVVVIVLTGYAATLADRLRTQAAWFACFLALGYFSAWSAGRGQTLALAVVLVLLVASRRIRWRDHRTWLLPSGLLLGGLGIAATGHTGLFALQFARSAQTPPAPGVEPPEAGSGRLEMWRISLDRVDDSLATLLFGHGPDAFDRLRLGEQLAFGAQHQFVHPHNTVVQWLLEMGVVGTVLGLVLLGGITLRALRELYGAGSAPGLPRVVAALLLGLFVYSLTDGLFYHVVPMTVIALLSGYLLMGAPRPVPQETSARRGAGGTPLGRSPRARARARCS